MKPSNGTMMDYWLDRWCFRCVHDHGYSHKAEGDPAEGCELLCRLYLDDPTPEIISHDDWYDTHDGWGPDAFECRLFERCPCEDDDGWEPKPPPKPDPNQGLLFEVIDESPGIPMVVIPIGEPAHAARGSEP